MYIGETGLPHVLWGLRQAGVIYAERFSVWYLFPGRWYLFVTCAITACRMTLRNRHILVTLASVAFGNL